VKRGIANARVAVDTNVLVRYLTWDDDGQARAAANILETATAAFVSNVVVCELAWVLKRAYAYADKQIAEAIRELMLTQSIELNHMAAEAGLKQLAKGGDFADGVIQFEAHSVHCDRLVTFDRKFARDGKLLPITLLEES
jgi:predicted nucleic-acid-binding protein